MAAVKIRDIKGINIHSEKAPSIEIVLFNNERDPATKKLMKNAASVTFIFTGDMERQRLVSALWDAHQNLPPEVAEKASDDV